MSGLARAAYGATQNARRAGCRAALSPDAAAHQDAAEAHTEASQLHLEAALESVSEGSHITHVGLSRSHSKTALTFSDRARAAVRRAA